MPFKSKAQMKACFASDGFGGKVDCREWARETKNTKSLPKKKKEEGGYNMYRPKNCKKCGGMKRQTGGIQTYTQTNTPQGAITPTGQSNLARLSPEQIKALASQYGFRTDSNANLQQDLFNYAQANQPQAYQAMIQKYGPTAAGTFVDNMLGARTSELLQSLPAPQQQPAPRQPYRVTSTFNEHIFGPGNRALGSASNRYFDSYDITDAGAVDTGSPKEYVNFQFYKPNTAELDPSRGTYRIPNDVYMNQIARGTNTIANPALLDQYRIPDNLTIVPNTATTAAVKQQGGPMTGLTHGPTYNFGPLSRTTNKQDSVDYRYNMNLAMQNPEWFEQRYVRPAFGIAARQSTPIDDVNKWLDIGLMNRGALQDAQRDLQNFGPNATAAPVVLYQPKDVVKKMKMTGGRWMYQTGGSAPRQQDYPDYESWQAAMDQWTAGQQGSSVLPSNTPLSMNAFDNVQGLQGFTPSGDMTSAATWDPMGAQNTPTYASAQRNPSVARNGNPYQTLQNIGLTMQGIRTGLGEIAGRVERGRQNQYDYEQQTALGQMNPMPTDDFQPNPYNLYMEHGGNLKTILKDFNKYTNDAQMDFGSGDDDKGMMKKGGYEIDRMIIVRKLLPELLKLGRLGSAKYRNYKKGGIHIKKENRGKFTEYCGGKVTGECIQRGLNSSNPTTRKRANFARNARKWN